MALCFSVHAEINDEIKELQQEWARIKYTLDKKDHEAALEKLSLKAATIRENQPENADAHLWEGTILSTYSGAIGTLRALSTVTQSRDALELSIKIDPTASKGAAHTYLGALYVLVPEWPIAFGDLEIAEEYLNKAIELNPDDIDVNYYYGYFLMKQRKYEQAEVFFKKALLAPERLGRDIADDGRRKDTKEQLEKVRAELE
jgi:tetratricopeptide (TPR) repeat protein